MRFLKMGRTSLLAVENLTLSNISIYWGDLLGACKDISFLPYSLHLEPLNMRFQGTIFVSNNNQALYPTYGYAMQNIFQGIKGL